MLRRAVVAEQEPLIDPEGRSPLWLDIATTGSLALGVTEAVVGTIGRSNALLANAIELLDNSTYGLDSVAARNENNRKKNHRLRRIAGSIICMASLGVGANATYDLISHKSPKLESIDATFAATATILNASFIVGLKKNANRGTTHRDAYRHATADTISSALAVGAIIASNNGLPTLDAWAGIGFCAWTIVMTLPTNARIESADYAFMNDSSEHLTK